MGGFSTGSLTPYPQEEPNFSMKGVHHPPPKANANMEQAAVCNSTPHTAYTD